MERVQVAATAANTVSYIYDGGPNGAVVAAAPTQNGVRSSVLYLLDLIKVTKLLE